MKIGICAGAKDIEKIRIYKEAGFEYIETTFSAYAKETKEVRDAFRAVLAETGLKCESMNGFIGEKVVGPDFSEERVKTYLESAFEVCSETGFEVVVFGSGGARRVPEGFSFDEAKKQFAYVCSEFVEPLCEKYGKYVAVENLNKGETNIFNTDTEINDLVNKMKLPRVKLLCDNYHMALENEPYSVIPTFGANLIHAHIANPDGRIYPQPSDAHDYTAFFDAMRKAGYNGRVSVEASAPKDIDLSISTKLCADFLKKISISGTRRC